MKMVCNPIPLDQMQTNMGDPGFSQQVGNDLGDVGTPTDGFDGLLATLADAISNESDFLPFLDWCIVRADFSPGEFAGSELDSVISLFATGFAVGDALVNVVNSSIATGVPVPPPPNTPVVTSRPIVTAPVHDPIAVGGGTFGGEPPWFDPTNPGTWADASGGGSMIPSSNWLEMKTG